MINSCSTVYDAWESLRVAYEGDYIVKEQEVEASQSWFEDLRMNEKEPFNYFYLHLSILINCVTGTGNLRWLNSCKKNYVNFSLKTVWV